MITKNDLDKLVLRYETEAFIKDDPIQFIHKFSDKKDIEIIGFITSLLAYGSRKQFIKKIDELLIMSQNEPYNFITNFDDKLIGDFNYRFGKPKDFVEIFNILKKLYNSGSSLEEVFEYGYKQDKIFETVVDYFYSNVQNEVGQGFYHMIPNPRNGGAMKRMCMLLRWFVRKSIIDLGIWKFMTPAELYIPLDVHVGNVSRELGLLTRKANDFKAVIELTNKLKEFCPEDPIKYDFALFGYGVNNKK